MERKSTTGEAATRSQPENALADSELPVAREDLEKLARWVPRKEMSLLIEICDRARRDPDLARPALLLCWAYGERVARMLDQDPLPTVTQKIAQQLRQMRERSGL
jgi:hypothetical protein